MSTPHAPVIGIRDSGVGGLTVARRIRQLLPRATLLYFADTAHVPYGDRTPDEVRHFALSISQFLLDLGAELLVFACNTSSAYALELARERFAAPVVGMIEPGARAALAVADGPIGVLATQATVESGVYTASLQALDSRIECIEIACPEFVPLVESSQTDSMQAREAAANYLEPLRAACAETIILGCTHYPLLLPVLREAAPGVRFIDPAEAVAEEVSALVRERLPYPLPNGQAYANGASKFFVSGPDGGVRDWVAELMGLPHAEIEICPGPVFDLCAPVR